MQEQILGDVLVGDLQELPADANHDAHIPTRLQPYPEIDDGLANAEDPSNNQEGGESGSPSRTKTRSSKRRRRCEQRSEEQATVRMILSKLYSNVNPNIFQRRRAQNRSSQRAYRDRKDQLVKELQHQTEALQRQNQELKETVKVLKDGSFSTGLRQLQRSLGMSEFQRLDVHQSPSTSSSTSFSEYWCPQASESSNYPDRTGFSQLPDWFIGGDGIMSWPIYQLNTDYFEAPCVYDLQGETNV